MGDNVKHTPGPWIFYADLPSTEPNWHIVTTANKMRVIANVHIEPGNAMDEANANLISAAPDLLVAATLFAESLKYLIALDRKKGDDEGAAMKSITLQSVRAAIAKAEARP